MAVAVREEKGRLYLLGSFPNKDGSGKSKQYKVTLQLEDNPTNRKLADKKRRKAEKDLKSGRWDWEEWSVRPIAKGSGGTWRQGIEALRHKKCVLGKCKPTSFETNHMGTLKFAPMSSPVTTKGMHDFLNKYDREQYTYKKLYHDLKNIALLLGVKFPEAALPLYAGPKDVTKFPSDAEIVDSVLSMPVPYRWYFGMMAAYGLRDHEVDVATLQRNEDLGIWECRVPESTKTGFRLVPPMEEEWVDLFDLTNKTPRPTQDKDATRSDGCAVWMNAQRHRMGIKWRPYALRHAYAGRLWRSGVPDTFTAARYMGHSEREHSKTYKEWIDSKTVIKSGVEAIRAYKAARKQG